MSSRIGHFAANTELYLCERDAKINTPLLPYVDLFYMPKPICNQQLATMWRRILNVYPAWFLARISEVNRLIPGGAIHEIGDNSQGDRDVHNLLDKTPPHLHFTPEEEIRGKAELLSMGIPQGERFACLMVRDSAYLESYQPAGNWRYQDYRDCNIQNYVLAAEELANRGFFVVRMGAKVHSAINSSHPRMIDYAVNGNRSDFMDIYLGANCECCISTSTGWDTVPSWLFRKPILLTHPQTVESLPTYSNKFILLTKRHFLSSQHKELSLKEILAHDIADASFTSDLEAKGIQVVENTPEEIRDAAIEMVERLEGTWRSEKDEEELQSKFREIFTKEIVNAERGQPRHGKIRAHFSSVFLRKNREWLQ